MSPSKNEAIQFQISAGEANRLTSELQAAISNLKPNKQPDVDKSPPPVNPPPVYTPVYPVSLYDNATLTEFNRTFQAINQKLIPPITAVHKALQGGYGIPSSSFGYSGYGSSYDYGSPVTAFPRTPQLAGTASIDSKLYGEIQEPLTPTDFTTGQRKVWQNIPTAVKIWNGSAGPDLAMILKAAIKEATDLTVQDFTSDVDAIRTEVQRLIEKVESRVASLISKRQHELQTLGTRITVLDQQLKGFEISLQQAGRAERANIDSILVYAVFFMIVAIVVLFMTLRIFPETLAARIVAERTMIELLSMGFLLTTIIILGTSKLIEGQALGALLGTIAGYIFGRKESERNAEERSLAERLKKAEELLALNQVSQKTTPQRTRAAAVPKIPTKPVAPAPSVLRILSAAPLPDLHVTVMLDPNGGAHATMKELQYQLPGEMEFGHSTPITENELTVGPFDPGITVSFRTRVANSKPGFVTSPIVTVNMAG